MRAHVQLDSEMPLRQYFLFVGGALLTLLFAANWLMPLPPSNGLINSNVKLPVIRIHSELKGPEAVMIDTGKSTIGPMLAARQDIVTPQAVTPSESTPDEAFAHLDVPLRQQAEVNEQKKTGEGQRKQAARSWKPAWGIGFIVHIPCMLGLFPSVQASTSETRSHSWSRVR
jgi:hypothetical protein